MSLAIICGLICMVAYGFAALYGTYASRASTPLVASLWSFTIADLIAIVLFPSRHIPWASVTPLLWLYLILTAIFVTAAFFLSNYSFTHGNASVHQTIVSTNGAIVAILVVTLVGEHLTTLQWVALAITFLGAILCSINLKRFRKGGLGLSTAAALASALLYGIGNTLNKYVIDQVGWYLPVLVIVSFGSAILIVIAIRTRAKLWPRRGKANLLWYGLLTGVVSYVEIIGYAIGPASVVAVLVTANIIVFAIIAHFKLKDRITRSQQYGIGVTMLGITLLTLFGR